MSTQSDTIRAEPLPDLWRGPLSLPLHMPVHQAREALRQSGQRCALVVWEGERIGVITEDELADAPPSAVVGDWMEWAVVRVPVGADEAETVRRHERAAWRWLLRPKGARPDTTLR